MSSREAIVTLVACALLGFEAGWSFWLTFAVLFNIGMPSYLLYGMLSLALGGVLGVVLLRRGGISIPTREERGASIGALVGFVVGVVFSFLLSGPIVAESAPVY